MNSLRLCVAALALSLASCAAVSVRNATEALASKPVCCAGSAGLPWSDLLLGTRHEFVLNADAPVKVFDGQRAYFGAFRLPQGARRLTVQSTHADLLAHASFVDPVLVFLDRNGEQVAVVRGLPLAPARRRLLPGVYEGYIGTQATVPQTATHVILYADPVSARSAPVFSENGKLWNLSAAAAGVVGLIAE